MRGRRKATNAERLTRMASNIAEMGEYDPERIGKLLDTLTILCAMSNRPMKEVPLPLEGNETNRDGKEEGGI